MPGSDPSVSGKALVFEGRSGQALLRTGGDEIDLQGSDAAVGGRLVAVVRGEQVALLGLEDLEQVGSISAPAVDALAVSRRWVVIRRHVGNRDVLSAHPSDGSGEAYVIATAKSPAQLSRPGDRGQHRRLGARQERAELARPRDAHPEGRQGRSGG